MAFAFLALIGETHAYSDDTRPNPFKAPPSAQEQQLIQDERTRNVVRGIQGEIVDRVAVRFERKVDTMEQNLKQKVDEAIKSAKLETASGAATNNSSDPNTKTAANSSVPQGATFIACVNKKALYRDKENSLFQDSSENNRCVTP